MEGEKLESRHLDSYEERGAGPGILRMVRVVAHDVGTRPPSLAMADRGRLFKSGVVEDIAGAVHDDVGCVGMLVGTWGCMVSKGANDFPRLPRICRKIRIYVQKRIFAGNGMVQ